MQYYLSLEIKGTRIPRRTKLGGVRHSPFLTHPSCSLIPQSQVMSLLFPQVFSLEVCPHALIFPVVPAQFFVVVL